MIFSGCINSCLNIPTSVHFVSTVFCMGRIVTLILFLIPVGSLCVHAQDVEEHLTALEDLVGEMIDLSQSAAEAETVDEVKTYSANVFEIIWGIPASENPSQLEGAVGIHGWKTRWQATNGDFDASFSERYGNAPPEIVDVTALGIIGRGRAIRRVLQDQVEGETLSSDEIKTTLMMIASLNNVIGWMTLDDGVTKGERQPRVDLTREWDAEPEFWLSTADTGWLYEVYAQSINIMKVDYVGEVDEARQHARAMHDLAMKVMDGVDANEDGRTDPLRMEGGIQQVMDIARSIGLVSY